MKYTRTSTYLIFLTGILLLINSIMVFFVFRTMQFLENDAWIINSMGIIRGAIQRITKLELSGHLSSCDSLVQQTDLLIETFLLDEGKNQFSVGYDDLIISYMRDIEYKWRNLKNHLSAYRHNRSDQILKQIVLESESCWETADFAVLRAQSIAENKVSGIKFLYIILSVYAMNTLIVIWVVYSYVRKNLEYRASHDSLTGLLNRHSYENCLETEFERSKRYNHTVSLILFDIDHFKDINDTYGHKTGDKILTALSQTVKNSIRKSDAVFRIGGEEFAIIIPETGLDRSSIIAEKIRKEVEKQFLYRNIKVTISLGVAESTPEKTQSDLYRQADEALYKAKNNGRNKVEKY